ncbi:hypothetical protein RhiirA4_478793 [Rhizophagus irregularis]|uniref:Uncharacterized protein n=1 Tax=Rhizophagus irregularis TaxID=588596 RepID=A0A2I1HFF0_9GLOM|nr:hypothetical protein RhiirA4_478793 [Rhizophagus irregularis]
MSLCGEIDNAFEPSLWSIALRTVAPETLKKKPYTQAADIYRKDYADNHELESQFKNIGKQKNTRKLKSNKFEPKTSTQITVQEASHEHSELIILAN